MESDSFSNKGMGVLRKNNISGNLGRGHILGEGNIKLNIIGPLKALYGSWTLGGNGNQRDDTLTVSNSLGQLHFCPVTLVRVFFLKLGGKSGKERVLVESKVGFVLIYSSASVWPGLVIFPPLGYGGKVRSLICPTDRARSRMRYRSHLLPHICHPLQRLL